MVEEEVEGEVAAQSIRLGVAIGEWAEIGSATTVEASCEKGPPVAVAVAAPPAEEGFSDLVIAFPGLQQQQQKTHTHSLVAQKSSGVSQLSIRKRRKKSQASETMSVSITPKTKEAKRRQRQRRQQQQ